MYKLIIGNVRVTVTDDGIKRDQAAAAAKKAIQDGEHRGKLYSLIEIAPGPNGLALSFTEKANGNAVHKDIRHSMLDAMAAAVRERLSPADLFGGGKNYWMDEETGREWRGFEVENTRKDILGQFENWIKSL